MKKLRDLIREVRLPTAKGERDFYKAHVDNTEVVDDPANKGNKQHPLKNLPKTYTGKNPPGGRVAESIDPKDARRGKMDNHHPKSGRQPETPIKEEVELLSEDEMARRAYVYERIFTLIDDITEIVDEFYTEEKDYENAINKRRKEYLANPDKDPKTPFPEYPTRPWSIANVARTLDDLYQELLGNTNRDVDHVYEEVELIEMRNPGLFKKADETIDAQLNLKTKVDKKGQQEPTGGNTDEYSDEVDEETELEEISKQTLQSYRNKAGMDKIYHKAERDYNQSNHDKPGQGDGAKAHYRKYAEKAARKLKNREDGIAKATKKLGEETEQIDEISQKLAVKYLEKANAEHPKEISKGYTAYDDGDKKTAQKHFNKANNRMKGIGVAAKKIRGFNKIKATEEAETIEVEQIDELSQTTKTNYLMKATADRAEANKESKDAIAKAQKVGKRDPLSGRALLAIARKAAERRDRREKGLSKL